MAKWNEGKKQDVGGAAIERLNYKECPLKIRIIDDYIPRYQYWIKTAEGNNRTIECLSFNRENESFDNEKDDLLKGKLDEKNEQYRAQFSYVIQCIDRKDGKVKVLELKKTVFNELIRFVQDSEYGDPADPETGYDLTITKEKTGPLPMNVKYSVLPGRKITPLTDKELKLQKYDIEKLYKLPSKEEQEEWLRSNTTILDSNYVDNEVANAVEGVPIEDNLPI